MQPSPIVFLSPRLRCRPWSASDLATIHAVYGDADAMRWVGDGSPITPEDAARWLEVTEANYARRGYGMFALDDRASGEPVGFAGLVHPDDQPEAEVKYALARAHWGRGLATEAVRHLLVAAHDVYGLTDAIATVAPEHVASQRVLAKVGMERRSVRTNPDGTTTVVYGCRLPLGEASVLERLRGLCLALPAVEERLSHGAPAWFVRGKRLFATLADGHHDDRAALWCAAPPSAQEAFVANHPDRYFRPPYVGPRGWLGVYLDVDVDWGEVDDHVRDAYRTVAPQVLVAALDRPAELSGPAPHLGLGVGIPAAETEPHGEPRPRGRPRHDDRREGPA